MEALPCIVVPAFIALVVALFIVGIVQARRRREECGRLAVALGFDYHPDDPWDLPTRYAFFDLFKRGHGRRASNILCGQADGRAVTAFDYQYTTGSGKNRTTHHCQAAVFALPIQAAGLHLRTETVFDHLAAWVGYDDLDFESEEFSRRYHVKSTDRKFAYDIFHAQLIDYLLRCGTVPDIEMRGPVMVLSERQGPVENFRRFLAIGSTIVRSIPDYVQSARGLKGAAGGAP